MFLINFLIIGLFLVANPVFANEYDPLDFSKLTGIYKGQMLRAGASWDTSYSVPEGLTSRGFWLCQNMEAKVTATNEEIQIETKCTDEGGEAYFPTSSFYLTKKELQNPVTGLFHRFQSSGESSRYSVTRIQCTGEYEYDSANRRYYFSVWGLDIAYKTWDEDHDNETVFSGHLKR